MRKIVAVCSAIIAAVGSFDAAVAQDYPSRTIKIVVPYPAGGPADVVGRTAAEALAAALKQSVVVENKAGATGTIGSESVARSTPDGYTLLMGLMGPMSIAPKISPRLSYDPLKDFEPVRLVALMPEILVARPSLGINTLADLVGYDKARPGKLTIASAGNGSLPHLAAELLKRETGIGATHVPYRGAAPAVNDILGNHVDIMFGDGPVVMPQIEAGQLTAVVLASPKRLPSLPNVPTSAEAGFPTVLSENWYGVLAPKGTPRPVVDLLDRTLARALAEPGIVASLTKLGVIVVNEGTPETFSSFLADQIEKWGGLAKAAGVKME